MAPLKKTKSMTARCAQVEEQADYHSNHKYTAAECPKIYRKSVLQLLRYTANFYLSRYSTHLR